jgi:acyl-coenzyme A thioesterase PaaI-like protein
VDLPDGDIARDTVPTPVAGLEGRYEATIPEAWKVFYAFGGVTMALAIRTAEAALGRPELGIVTVQATFCQAVPCGPVAMAAEVLRSGRKGAQVQVRLWATEDSTGPVEPDLVVTVVFGLADPTSPHRLVGATFPSDAPGPEASRLRVDVRPDNPFAEIPYHRQTDWRQAIGHAPWDSGFAAGEDPRAVSWFRFLRPPLRADGTWEPATLAVPGDILAPAVVEGLGRMDGWFFVITLQLSMQFFAPMRGEFLCQHTRAHHAGDGFATGVAELWREDRTLVAIATQSAMLQPMKAG